MAFIAACLLAAVASACCIIVALLAALFDYAAKRDAAEGRAEHAEAEADRLQSELNAALGRLSRKRKPSLSGGVR